MKNTFLTITLLIPLFCFSQTYIHGTGKTAIKMTSTRASYYYNKNRNDCNCENRSFYENYSTYKNQPKYDFKNPKHSKKCVCWTRNPKQVGPQSYALNSTYPKGKWINEHFIDEKVTIKKDDYSMQQAYRDAFEGGSANLVDIDSINKALKEDEEIKKSIRVANEKKIKERDSISQLKQTLKDLKNLKEQHKQDSIQEAFQKHIKEMDIIAKKRVKGLIRGDYSN